MTYLTGDSSKTKAEEIFNTLVELKMIEKVEHTGRSLKVWVNGIRVNDGNIKYDIHTLTMWKGS